MKKGKVGRTMSCRRNSKFLLVTIFKDYPCFHLLYLMVSFETVSQFTLYAELKGNKPDFHSAMKSSESKKLYENVLQSLRNQYSNSPEIIQEGVFGNRMEVALVNDGPVTIQLDSRRDSPQEKSSSSSLLNKTETIATDNENLPIRDGIVEKQEKTAIQSAELTEANYK